MAVKVPTKFAADYDYTDEQLLALVREAIARVTKHGGESNLLGNTYTEAHLDELRQWEEDLKSRISANRGTALVVGRMRRA